MSYHISLDLLTRRTKVNNSLSPVAVIFLLIFNYFSSQGACQETATLILSDASHSESFKTEHLYNDVHGIQMGVSDKSCDDGKSNLEVDWDNSPVNYTCYTPKTLLPVNQINPILECEYVPDNYLPKHYCMSYKIEYDSPLPTHAGHRPLWAVFGEYKFLPPQRWSHNIEHGAVVMLYHPCTHSTTVKEVKRIVRTCIRKHVITPSNLVSEKYPIVLITWGCRLHLTSVNEQLIKNYIKSYALNGPEGNYSKEGQYDYLLVEKASVPEGSNADDATLCPEYPE